MYSCGFDKKGYEFKNFENTPLNELAIAVKNNDVLEMQQIIKHSKLNINYLEPVNKQSLLSLSIVNEKEEAFLQLLQLGANPNIILGTYGQTSAITEAINNRSEQQIYFVKNLLKFNANPNLEIIPNHNEFFLDYYPLISAIRYTDEDDLEIIKLLIDNGANMYCCNPTINPKEFCEGVLEACLSGANMVKLRYLIIEKKIKIPDIVFILGSGNKKTQEKLSLSEMLNTENFLFEDFVEEDGIKQTFNNQRKIKKEILDYLKKTNQY